MAGKFFLLIIIKSGARRRIGNRENTLVWRDPWPPGVANVYVRTTTYNDHEQSNIKVSSLMTDDKRDWDVEVIEDLPETRDCELIKLISLSIHISADSWY